MQKLGHSYNLPDTSSCQTYEISTYYPKTKNSRATRKSYLEVSVYSSRSAINLTVLQSEYLPTESIDIDKELPVNRDSCGGGTVEFFEVKNNN